MSTYTALAAFDGEPTDDELTAIDAEAPVIAAQLDVVNAECRLALSPDELAIKAHRRAVTRLNVVLRTNRTTTAPVYAAGSPLSTARRVVIRPATRTA